MRLLLYSPLRTDMKQITIKSYENRNLSNSNAGHRSFFSPHSFQLRAVTLQGTSGPNISLHGAVAGVTDTTLTFLTMGWPTQHQT